MKQKDNWLLCLLPPPPLEMIIINEEKGKSNLADENEDSNQGHKKENYSSCLASQEKGVYWSTVAACYVFGPQFVYFH